MPLIVPELVHYIIENFQKSKKSVCVPRWSNGYLEPLHAVYSQKFRNIIENNISKGEYALNKAIKNSDPCYVDIENFSNKWKKSFFNVNTKEDLESLNKQLRHEKRDCRRV